MCKKPTHWVGKLFVGFMWQDTLRSSHCLPFRTATASEWCSRLHSPEMLSRISGCSDERFRILLIPQSHQKNQPKRCFNCCNKPWQDTVRSLFCRRLRAVGGKTAVLPTPQTDTAIAPCRLLRRKIQNPANTPKPSKNQPFWAGFFDVYGLQKRYFCRFCV